MHDRDYIEIIQICTMLFVATMVQISLNKETKPYEMPSRILLRSVIAQNDVNNSLVHFL